MSKIGKPFVLWDYKAEIRMWAVILRMIYASWLFGSVLSTNVTITSTPQLGVDTVCDNQDVTLMCHTDQTTGNMITWYWSKQSQHGDTITVVAKMTGVVYTCVASNDGENMGDAKVTVVANGSSPQVDRRNFNPYVLKYERSNLTLITEISSDLPLPSGDIKWVGFHRPLPSTAVVDNYTTDGVLYSRLSLYELSFEDDSGNYTNIVSNQCGTSSVSVYIDVRKAPIVCNNSGSVAVPQKDIMTVKGESIVLQCLFKGNLKILWPSMSSYWMIGSHDQWTQNMYIMDNSTDPYRIAVYQTCLSEDGSCCNFTNKLTIHRVPLELNGVHLECGEVLDEIKYSNSTELTVLEAPKVIRTSDKHIQASLNQTVTMFCLFSASTLDGVTEAIWLKDGLVVNSSSHYTITTRPSSYKPVLKSTVLTNLTIVNFTAEDKGVYSCQTYYNPEKVTSNKTVTSERVFFTVNKGDSKPFGGVEELGIASGMVAGVILIIVIFAVIRHYKILERVRNRFEKVSSPVMNTEEMPGYGATNQTIPQRVSPDDSENVQEVGVDKPDALVGTYPPHLLPETSSRNVDANDQNGAGNSQKS